MPENYRDEGSKIYSVNWDYFGVKLMKYNWPGQNGLF